MIWKGTGDAHQAERPLTCSYSFGKAGIPPTDRLRSKDTSRCRSLRPASSVTESHRHAELSSQQRQAANRWARPKPSTPSRPGSLAKEEDELESILCVDNDRAKCCTMNDFLMEDFDEVAEFSLASRTSHSAVFDMSSRFGASPPQQPSSSSPPPSLGDPVTPFVTPSNAMQAAAPAPLDQRQDLDLALKAHGIEGSTAAAVRRLGIRRVTDLSMLRMDDLEDASHGFNVLERRLLQTAIDKESAAVKRSCDEMTSASRTWSRLTDDRGWYAPAFSSEPPGLRITVLEPMDMAGTVMDISFGQSRTNLSSAATRSFRDESTGEERFELSLKLGRADRTEFVESSGLLTFGVVGVSRQHTEIVLSCGDSCPATCCVRDLGSTNGTFFIRPAATHPPWNTTLGSAQDETGNLSSNRSSSTSSDSLLQLQVDKRNSSDASGIPYLRLGPKLVLGLSLLRGTSTNFKLQDVAVLTERLYSEPDLRGLGWEDAALEHVFAAKRHKERVAGMLDALAAGGRAAARRFSQGPAALSVQTHAAPLSDTAPRDVLAVSPEGRSGAGEQHVFLSYQWDCQALVKAVAQDLKARGYKVWLDVEQMRGEMNQRMAEAVEGAAIVCPFISRTYKQSANCMKELNYSDQLGKPMLPVIVDDFNRNEV